MVQLLLFYYRPRSEGNVFTSVRHSVHRTGRGCESQHALGQRGCVWTWCVWTPPPPRGWPLTRSAPILLECILVSGYILNSCTIPASDDSRLTDQDHFDWEGQEASLYTIYMATLDGYLILLDLYKCTKNKYQCKGYRVGKDSRIKIK